MVKHSKQTEQQTMTSKKQTMTTITTTITIIINDSNNNKITNNDIEEKNMTWIWDYDGETGYTNYKQRLSTHQIVIVGVIFMVIE